MNRRSMADLVWSHKWLTAKVNIENLQIKITGINVKTYAAFDTIKRHALLLIYGEITNELRIIQFFLIGTEINNRMNDANVQLLSQAMSTHPKATALIP